MCQQSKKKQWERYCKEERRTIYKPIAHWSMLSREGKPPSNLSSPWAVEEESSASSDDQEKTSPDVRFFLGFKPAASSEDSAVGRRNPGRRRTRRGRRKKSLDLPTARMADKQRVWVVVGVRIAVGRRRR